MDCIDSPTQKGTKIILLNNVSNGEFIPYFLHPIFIIPYYILQTNNIILFVDKLRFMNAFCIFSFLGVHANRVACLYKNWRLYCCACLYNNLFCWA